MNQSATGFDIWTTFFASAALLGLGCSVWLLWRSTRHRAFIWLGLLLLLFAISISEWVLWWTGYIDLVPECKAISKPFPFFFGVLLLAYYRAAFPDFGSLPKSSRFLQFSLVGHVIPGAIYALKLLPILAWHWGFRLYNWNTLTFISPKIDGVLYVMYAHMLLYPWLIYKGFMPVLKQDTEMTKWHGLVIKSFWAIGLAYLMHHMLSLMGWMSLRLDYLIAFFIVLFMGLIIWLGFVQPHILAGLPFIEAILPVKYRKSALSPAAANELARQLQEMFAVEKTYLDPDLTLDRLAKQMRISRHHISQAVNSVFKLRFSEWLAQWRVEEAKSLFAREEGQNMIVKEVAYAAGFNSKTAFNDIFKKWTGLTPSEYKAENRPEG